ncbi:MAG: PqiC family protein [Kiloniellales bacterium]
MTRPQMTRPQMTRPGMTRPEMTWSLRTLILAAAVGLAACGSSPPPSTYTLVPIPPATTAPAGALALSVQDADIPRYLDRPQVVRYNATYQLEVAENARWGEPFAAMVTRVLVLDLARRLPGAQVFRASDSTSVPPQLSLEVTFNAFEANPANQIVLNARWVVRQGERGDVVSSDATEIITQPAEPTLPGMAAAMSQALAQMSDLVIASLPGY